MHKYRNLQIYVAFSVIKFISAVTIASFPAPTISFLWYYERLSNLSTNLVASWNGKRKTFIDHIDNVRIINLYNLYNSLNVGKYPVQSPGQRIQRQTYYSVIITLYFLNQAASHTLEAISSGFVPEINIQLKRTD